MLTQSGFPNLRGHKALIMAFLIDALGTGLYLPFSLLYFQQIVGIDALPAIGVALTLANVLTLPLTPLTGILVDRLGAKRLVIASQILQASGFLGYLIVNNLPLLFGMAFFVTAGGRIFYAAATALVAETASHDEGERWYGFVGVTRNAGLTVGGLLAGFIVASGGANGYRVLILANALSFLLTAGVLCWHKTSPGPRGLADTPGGYRAVLADRPFLLLVACNVVFALCTTLLSVGLPLYASEALKVSTVVVGALFGFGSMLTICAQTLVVRLLESLRRTHTLALASMVWVLGSLLLALAPLLPSSFQVPYLFAVMAVYTLAGLMANPTTTALAAASSPPHLRGRYMAAYEFSVGIAGTISPTFFTLLYTLGPAWPWVVLAGPTLLVGLLMLRFEKLSARLPQASTSRSRRD